MIIVFNFCVAYFVSVWAEDVQNVKNPSVVHLPGENEISSIFSLPSIS